MIRYHYPMRATQNKCCRMMAQFELGKRNLLVGWTRKGRRTSYEFAEQVEKLLKENGSKSEAQVRRSLLL